MKNTGTNAEKVSNSSKKEIQIKLVTELSEEYQLNDSVFSLPSEATPKKLNQLLQKLLSTDKTFSFFINQIKLEQSLNEFVNTHLLSSESTIEVYYILEINEPQHTNTIKEDEWIKRIQLLKQMKYEPNKKSIYTVGLFNGDISFYNEENKKLFTLKTGEDNTDDDNAMSLLTDLKMFKKEDNKFMIRTMKNYDKILEIFEVDFTRENTNIVYEIGQNYNEFYSTIDLNPFDYNILAVGGSDSNSKGVVDIFKLPSESKINSKNSAKKRKTEKQKLVPDKTFRELHNSVVENVSFLNEDKLLTTGDDFIINLFNLNSNSLFLTYNTNFKRPTCMQIYNPDNFIVGFQDGSLKLYDSRIGNKSVSQFRDKNSNFISDICFHGDKDQFKSIFSTTGYDGGFKIWDIRAVNEPLKRIEGKKDEKNYNIKFNGSDTILFGGNGSEINIYTI